MTRRCTCEKNMVMKNYCEILRWPGTLGKIQIVQAVIYLKGDFSHGPEPDWRSARRRWQFIIFVTPPHTRRHINGIVRTNRYFVARLKIDFDPEYEKRKRTAREKKIKCLYSLTYIRRWVYLPPYVGRRIVIDDRVRKITLSFRKVERTSSNCRRRNCVNARVVHLFFFHIPVIRRNFSKHAWFQSRASR